jgi:hypothetical protein
MQEQWIKWEPLVGLAPKYYINSMTNTIEEGLKVVFYETHNDKNEIHMLFKKSMYAYRISNESFRFKMIDKLESLYGAEFFTKWTFFKVDNSEYAQAVKNHNCKMSNVDHMMHFSILSPEYFVDILSEYEPEIRVVHVP